MKIGKGSWARPFASVLRVLAFTLVICATGGAWAAASAASLEETGGYVTAAPQLAFRSATLDDVKDHLTARMAGGWITRDGAKATVFNYIDVVAGQRMTCEAQIDREYADDNEMLKSVLLLFEASEGDVYVTAIGAKYQVKGDAELGTSIASSGADADLATSISASGYGLYYLGLDNRTNRSSATVLWESDFETAKVSADGYTYSISDLKGNTIDGDGNIAIASGNNHYGVLMTLPDQSKTKMSVLIKYKGLAAYTTANSGLFSFKTADNKVYGFRSNGSGQLKLTGFNESESSHWPPTPEEAITLVTGTGVYLVSTDTSVGISGYTGKGISALEGATVHPYASGSTISSITLGGSHNTNKIYAWDGVTIEKVAIFMGESYGPSDLADFVFPSDATSIPSDSNLHTVNVNFTHSSAGVSTESNLGLVGIPGTKWNNMAGANGAQSDIKVANLAGDSIYSYPELAVKVSGSRGSWECSSLTAASDLRRGYIDDNTSYTTPTITAGVPFEKYRVIVYHATDTGNAKFGYVTINGNNLCYDSDNWLRNGSGATSWGATGGSNTALAMEEGKNVLVSDVYTAKPLKIVGHRESGSVRGCIAAFQIVKVEDASIDADGTYTLSGLFGTVGANSDLVINVKESATLNIATATTVGSIEFNVDEGKTLTLTGSTLTAAVGIRITGKGVVSTSVLAQLSGTLKGDGILAYTLSNGASNLPSGPTWTRSAWRGTVWLKGNKSLQNFNPASYGNSGSTVRLTGMKGYFPNSTTSCEATVELVDDGETVAFEQDNAYNQIYTFKKVKGSGTFKVSGSQTSGHNIVMEDVSEFTGTLTVGRRTVALGAAPSSWPGVEGGTIYVASGTTATIENAKTWTAKNITVDGILKIIGSGRLSASGTVTCKGAKIDLSEAAGNPASAVINGALVIDASTTIDFPADATFPYTLATSLSGADSLSASSYTIGGCEGTSVLGLYSDSSSSKAWAYPPTSAEFSGGTVAWASLGWSPSYGDLANNMYYAECSISVKESGTITLPSTKVAKLTIDVPEGKTLTLGGTIYADEINFTGAGKVVCLQYSALSGMPECTIKGDEGITIEYPNKKLPLDSVKWIDEGWKGTLVITNCGLQNTLEEIGSSKHGSIPFDTYGNRYSKIKAPGFKGHSAANRNDAYCSAELIIDEGTTFEFNHGNESLVTTANAGFRFRKLSGSGTLRLDGTSDTAQYIFEDVASFTGIVEITNPNPDEEVGGKKSFILGAPTDWEIFGSDYPANLVIAGAVTVPGGVFWDTPAGVVILSGGTLTVGAGSSISGIDSKSLGTLAVAAGAQSGTVVELKQYAAGKAEITANLSIPEGATLKICDTNSTTRLTVPADSSASGTYSNAGTLDLSACTSLTELHLKLGDANLFDFTHIRLPSPVPTIVYDIGSVRDLAGYNLQTDVGAGTNYYYYATETAEEYANGGFAVSNVAAGVAVKMVRRNGTVIDTKVPTDGRPDDYRVYDGGRSFAGAACWHEWDFEQEQGSQKLWDSGRESTNATPVRVDLVTDGGSFDYYTYQGTEDKVCIPANVHPRAEEAMAFGDNWSAAVRCTMPSAAGEIAIAFGDTDNGILGLASGTSSGVVELFNWTNGVYTTLARLQVEHASDAMHIYVFAVTNDTTMSKRYASLYRDGEFIHKAELALSGSITNFMVGSVLVGDIAKPSLLIDAANGYVDYVRLYDRILNESEIEGLSLRRPFMSDYETYLRDINGIEYWSQPGEWVSKTNDTLTVATPTAGTHVTVNVEYESTFQVNLTPETAARYGTLIFKGSAPVTIAPTDDNNGRVSADMVVVRTPTIIRGPGVVDFSTSMVGVDEGAYLAFDFSVYPFAPTQEVIKVTGPVIAREYDATVDSRIIVTNTPSHTWTVGNPTPNLTQGEDYLSYSITITPSRTVGTDEIYYQGGYLTAGMTGDTGNDTGVFSDIAFESPTILLEGDKVQISSSSALGDSNNAWISDTFNGDIHVTRTTLNLMPGEHNNGILSNRTVTVDSGKTLNLKAQAARTFNFGALTLNGEGTINFADDAKATSLSGNAGITIADGKTLTLGSVASFVSGTVSGTGTVKLPAVTGSVNINTFGGLDSIVALTEGTSATMTDVAVTRTLRLDGSVIIVPTDDAVHSFAKITGAGDLTFSSDNEPSSITINNIENFAGSLNNDSSTEVTVSRITLPVDVAGGTLLLATNGVGSVTVSSVWFAGEESASGMPIAYADGGVYKAVAQVGGNYYATFEDAIAAATDSGLGTITVLEESASLLPSGYYFVPKSSPTQIAKYPVAVVKDGVVYSYTRNGIVVNCYYGSIMEALIAIFSIPALNPEVDGSYDYIEVLSGGSYGLPLGLVSPIKIKNSVGEAATFSATGIYEDTELTRTERGTYTEYGIGNRAMTYTWTGLATTVDSQWDEEKDDYVKVDVADPLWTSAANWSYVNSSSETVPASRYPQEGDTVVFSSDATVTVGTNVEVLGVTCSAAVSFSKSVANVTLTATTDGIVLTDRAATLTVSGVTLSPEPTTDVGGGARVISTTSAGVTTYKVVYGTIFSVY